ncbi:MAG: hypothetical protein Q9220_006155 [cf. Caloplaca sp. 1 TL-2023]
MRQVVFLYQEVSFAGGLQIKAPDRRSARSITVFKRKGFSNKRVAAGWLERPLVRKSMLLQTPYCSPDTIEVEIGTCRWLDGHSGDDTMTVLLNQPSHLLHRLLQHTEMSDLQSPGPTSQPRSVDSWLSKHPQHPNHYASVDSSLQGLKRPRQPRATHYERSQKRPILGELSPNAIPPSLSSQDQRNCPAPPRSLRSRGRSAPSDNADDEIEDVDPTPRATCQKSILANVADLISRNEADAQVEDEDDTSQNSRESPPKSTRSSQRTLSPRKARAYMEDADISVRIAKIPSSVHASPAGAQTLRKDLEALQKHKRLIDSSLRERGKEKLSDDDEETLYKDEEHTQTPEEKFSHLQTWHDVIGIEGAAEECEVEDLAEPSWNAEVHCKILRQALHGYWRAKEIWYRDITTARIFDKELLPKIPGLASKSKLVDFAIMIRPQETSPLEYALEKKCESMPSRAINQTDASYIRNKPIAISIEVKRPAGNEDISLVELETWVTAHFNMLKVLLRSNQLLGKVDLPILPLIQIQGHMWNLWIAEYKETEETGKQIIIHKRISLGSTDKVVGIYQVIASVQRLAQWANEDYRSWWIKHAAGIDPETFRESP